MKKKLLVISLILAPWFLIFCQELESAEREYSPCVLITLNYGSADNQVAITPEGDVEGEIGGGPSANFAVDSKGNIYICDEGNGKIKKFSNTGNLIFAINKWGNYRVDEQENMYVIRYVSLNDAVIDKYDKNGKFLCTIDYDPYAHTYEQDEQKKKILRAPPLEMAQVPRFSGHPLLVDSKGREYKVQYTMDTTWTKPEEIKIETSNSTDEVIGSFTLFPAEIKKSTQRAPAIGTPTVKLPDYKELKYGLDVEFVDGNGNIYAGGLAERGKTIVLMKGLYINSDLIVYKYDSQGNFITQIRFPFVPTVVKGERSPYVVDPSGNIYCLQFHKDGMDVVKYEWKAVNNNEAVLNP
ncbi:MAG: hypothetical protein AAB110_07605 [Candidatus Desantisbacteria bacterium]